MRLLFLVPMNIHKVTAGSRIRYDRLGGAGGPFDVVVKSLEELTAADLDSCDVYVFSKTYSAEAIALALRLRQRGKIVGIDLFDDYFSQTSDPRLSRFRTWLSCIAGVCDFALCSTHVMRRLLESYAPSLPVHVVPDPFPEIDPSVLARTAAAKVERAKRERAIDVVWYGNGSNPFFSVGLSDVAAFSWSLADLASGSFDVRLKILTDQASQTADNLVRLGKLPVRHHLETWSLDAEQESLEQALVSFIPVNGQSFSRAKSFNRALTAISAGTQVLSPGFPLYRDLAPAIYADAFELLSDIEHERCRLGADNVAEVIRVASELSEVGAVVRDLSAFLSGQSLGVKSSSPASFSHQAVIYGLEQDSLAMKAAQAGGILSVKTPFARRDHPYDIRIEHRRPLEVWIAPKLVPLLAAAVRSKCSAPQQVGKYPMVKVDAASATLSGPDSVMSPTDRRAIIQETESYRRYMVHIEDMLRSLFPTVQFFRSDLQDDLDQAKSSVGAAA